MKKALIFFILITAGIVSARAQQCEIHIKVLEGRYMYGRAEKVRTATKADEITVKFTADFMEVTMPLDGDTYLIKVVNENCKAYCPVAKRIRQLHSGDEKLVINLFSERKGDILKQIRECS